MTAPEDPKPHESTRLERLVATVRRLSERLDAARIRAQEGAARFNQALLKGFLRLTPKEQSRIYALTIAIGVVCGLVAVLFHFAIRIVSEVVIDSAIGATGHWWIAWTIITPTAGGVLAGVLLERLVPNARGSGVPQVKVVYAVKSGTLRLRDVIGKFFVSTLQIGAGASLGREGPTVHICSGIAASLGRLFALSPTNVRRMIPVGAAAGIAAAFNAPIAAVTFVIEEIVGALDTTVLSGVVIAAAFAAVVEHGILGEHPIFTVPRDYGLEHASSLVTYALLGVAAAGVAHFFSRALLELRARFSAMKRVPPWARPGIGGLVTGILAVAGFLLVRTHGITGGGYETLNDALNGKLLIHVMLVLCLLKVGSTVFSYSSGGSGGIFAPVLFIGGMLGGAFGFLDQLLFEHEAQLGAFAAVGMGALFAGVIRAPITSVLLMFEMTGGYGLVLPLMVSNMVAFILARRWAPRPIYEALIEQDGIRLPHDRASAPALTTFRVSDAMTNDPRTIPAEATIADGLEHIRGLPYASFPILDREGRLVGVLSEARLRRLNAEGQGGTQVARHARTREYLHRGQTLREALEAMGRLGIRQMAVVDDDDPTCLVGILAMSDVVRFLLRTEGEALRFPPSSATTSFVVGDLER